MATFTTTHFSWYSILAIDLDQTLATFKSDFIDGLDGGLTQTVDRPKCSAESAARTDGYSVASSTGDTVYWCFGMDSSGHRVLRVTDHRRYPLEIAHPDGVTVADRRDPFELATLSHLGSGVMAIVAPGGNVSFRMDVAPGHAALINTEMDATGQDLYALEVGVTTLVEILTKFGAAKVLTVSNAIGHLLNVESCVHAFRTLTSGTFFSGCFSPAAVVDAFGAKGLLLAAFMVYGPLIAFFQTEWNVIVDQFDHHDKYEILVKHADAQACTPTALFAAAVAKEHFNPKDPSYATDGDPAGASQLKCDGDWALGLISRPTVGGTDGLTVFHRLGTTWTEVAIIGTPDPCYAKKLGVPPSVVAKLITNGFCFS